MERYSFFQRLSKSVNHMDFACDVVNAVRTKAVSYLTILCLLITLVHSLVMLIQVYPLGGLNKLFSEISNFEFKNGYLETDLTEPLILDTSSNLIVVDTNPPSEIAMQKFENFHGTAIYFGSDMLISRSGFSEIPISYDQFDYSFTKADIQRIVSSWAWLGVLFACFFIFIGLWISGICYAFIIALIALIVNAATKAMVAFGKLFSLALYGLTAIFIIECVIYIFTALTGLDLRLPWYISYIVTSVYMLLYLLAVAKSKNNPYNNDGDPQIGSNIPR